jgi:hypothetical protein
LTIISAQHITNSRQSTVRTIEKALTFDLQPSTLNRSSFADSPFLTLPGSNPGQLAATNLQLPVPKESV